MPRVERAMLKRFIKDSALFTFVSLADKGIGSVMFFILGSRLSTADYGKLDLTTAVMMGATVVAGFELYQAVLRLYSERTTPEEVAELVSTAFWSVLGSAFVVAGLICWNREWVASIAYGMPHEGTLVVLGALWMTVYVTGSLLDAALRAALETRWVAIASCIRIVVQVTLALAFVLGFGWRAEGLLGAQVIGLLSGTLCGAAILRRRIRLIWRARVLFDMLRFSAPLLISSLCAIAAQQGDRLIVRVLFTVSDVGLLGTGYRLANVVGLLTSGVMMALTPMVFQYHAKPGTRQDIATLFRYYVVGGFCLCLGMTLTARPLLSLFLPPEYHAADRCVPFLIATVVAAQATTFFPGLVLAKRMNTYALIIIATLLVSIACGWVFGKAFGLLGVCAAGVLAQLSGCVAFAIFGHRDYAVPVEWNKVGPFLAGAAAIVMIWVLLPEPGWTARAALALAGAAMILGSRIVTAGEIREIVKFLKGRLRPRHARSR